MHSLNQATLVGTMRNQRWSGIAASQQVVTTVNAQPTTLLLRTVTIDATLPEQRTNFRFEKMLATRSLHWVLQTANRQTQSSGRYRAGSRAPSLSGRILRAGVCRTALPRKPQHEGQAEAHHQPQAPSTNRPPPHFKPLHGTTSWHDFPSRKTPDTTQPNKAPPASQSPRGTNPVPLTFRRWSILPLIFTPVPGGERGRAGMAFTYQSKDTVTVLVSK
jgi:hypothetical protein